MLKNSQCNHQLNYPIRQKDKIVKGPKNKYVAIKLIDGLKTKVKEMRFLSQSLKSSRPDSARYEIAATIAVFSE